MSSTNSKTLLVLAASLYQLEAIQTARRLGCRVITTDNRPDNPGHALADRAYGADTRDLDAVLAIARAERIAGVIAPCTDVAMPTAAVVAAELGLAGPPVSSTHIVCDKACFRDFQAVNGLPHPQFLKLKSPDELPELEAAKRWIVKPCQSSGSKGIRVVSGREELRAALQAAFPFSPSGEVVVEEFLPGHQGTCDGWLSAGRIAWHCLLDRQTVPLPFVVTSGHHLPTLLPPADQARVLDAVGEVWGRLGVTDGPFDCDFVVNPEAVFILELSPRLGGNSISDRSGSLLILTSSNSRFAGRAVMSWGRCRFGRRALPPSSFSARIGPVLCVAARARRRDGRRNRGCVPSRSTCRPARRSSGSPMGGGVWARRWLSQTRGRNWISAWQNCVNTCSYCKLIGTNDYVELLANAA